MEDEECQMSINVVSSLNLRMGRDNGKTLKEPIEFECSCGKRCLLGRDSFVLAKIEYELSGESCQVVLCDRCTDMLVDVARFGPRVIDAGDAWNIRSRVARISMVKEELYCFKCLGQDSSHLFMKFDDLSKDAVTYSTMRICARCAISYLTMLLNETVKR